MPNVMIKVLNDMLTNIVSSEQLGPYRKCIQINIFLFLHDNICRGYSLEVPRRYKTIYAFKDKLEKYRQFWLEKHLI